MSMSDEIKQAVGSGQSTKVPLLGSDFKVGYWVDFPGGGAPVPLLAGCVVLCFVSVM